MRTILIIVCAAIAALQGCARNGVWTLHSNQTATVYVRTVPQGITPAQAQSIHTICLGTIKPNEPMQCEARRWSDPVFQLVASNDSVQYLYGRHGLSLQTDDSWLPHATYDDEARNGVVKPGAFAAAVIFAWGWPLGRDTLYGPHDIEMAGATITTWSYSEPSVLDVGIQWPQLRRVTMRNGFVSSISR